MFLGASAGFETFDDLMLAAYIHEVGPNHIVRRSSSSVFVAVFKNSAALHPTQ